MWTDRSSRGLGVSFVADPQAPEPQGPPADWQQQLAEVAEHGRFDTVARLVDGWRPERTSGTHITEDMVDAGARAVALGEGRLGTPNGYLLELARTVLEGALGGASVGYAATAGDPAFEVIADYLAVNVGRCTCDGPFEIEGVEHRPGCGFEPVITLDELAVVLARTGRMVVEIPVHSRLPFDARERVERALVDREPWELIGATAHRIMLALTQSAGSVSLKGDDING